MKTKRKAIILTMILIFLITAASYAINVESGFSNTDYNANMQLALGIAENIKDSGLIFEEDKVIGYVNDLPIYRSEVELRKIFMDGMNKSVSPDDYRTAFNKVLIEKQELLILEEYDALVTEEEIDQFNDYQKEILYSNTDYPKDDEEQIAFHKEYVSALGLTEEEYWDVYKPTETSRHLTHLRVQELLRAELSKENDQLLVNNKNLQFELTSDESQIIIDIDSIEYTITDEHYSNLLKDN